MSKLTAEERAVLIEAARIMGSKRSPAKTAAARRNAKKRWDDYRKKKLATAKGRS